MQSRLKVRMPYEAPYPRQEIYDIEQARDLIFGRGPGIVVVEGEIVNSFDELKKIALEKYRNKELIDVQLIPIFEGG